MMLRLHRTGQGKSVLHTGRFALRRESASSSCDCDPAGRFHRNRGKIEQHSLSAHTSGPDLARFLDSVSNDGAKIVLTHGEPDNLWAMKGLLQENRKFSGIEVPSKGDRILL
jgi:Cft2 family RNA processing exonuclease